MSINSVETDNPTILVVDDEESIRITLCQILEDEGFKTVTAPDGPTALKIFSSSNPDLVILDIWMPEMDGIEVLRGIKQINPEIPVLMISGHASIATAVESTKLGATDFIEKPFDLDLVLETVNRFVNLNLPKLAKALKSSLGTVSNDKTKKSPVQSPIKPNPHQFKPIVFDSQLWRGNLVTQKTLKSSAILYGQCLHSGKKSGLILEPLPSNHGIHFASVADDVVIPAHVKYVRSTGFATTLQHSGLKVATVEHLLSSLHAYGISNLLIKCNDEVPVMDGSALEFCKLFDEIGLEEQSGDWFELSVPYLIKVGNDKEWIQIEPADNFSIDYTLNYPSPIGLQRLTYTLRGINEYKEEIAPARTFGFLKDVGYLQKQGLAQGGRFDNFILVGTDGPLNVELRFPDEFVRHKILDAIGDLYLLGRPLKGKITAQLTGHSDNIKLLQEIVKEILKHNV